MPQNKKIFGQKSYYDLSVVKSKIASKKVIIKLNAEELAYKDFGWGKEKIIDVYNRLQPKHFKECALSKIIYLCWLDYYKGIFYGEEVFTHFYINDEGVLVINSFHRDRKIK